MIGSGGKIIARHPRCYDREDMVFDPIHYLPLIEKKINALDQAAHLAKWNLPPEFVTDVFRIGSGCFRQPRTERTTDDHLSQNLHHDLGLDLEPLWNSTRPQDQPAPAGQQMLWSCGCLRSEWPSYRTVVVRISLRDFRPLFSPCVQERPICKIWVEWFRRIQLDRPLLDPSTIRSPKSAVAYASMEILTSSRRKSKVASSLRRLLVYLAPQVSDSR